MHNFKIGSCICIKTIHMSAALTTFITFFATNICWHTTLFPLNKNTRKNQFLQVLGKILLKGNSLKPLQYKKFLCYSYYMVGIARNRKFFVESYKAAPLKELRDVKNIYQILNFIELNWTCIRLLNTSFRFFFHFIIQYYV